MRDYSRTVKLYTTQTRIYIKDLPMRERVLKLFRKVKGEPMASSADILNYALAVAEDALKESE